MAPLATQAWGAAVAAAEGRLIRKTLVDGAHTPCLLTILLAYPHPPDP